MPSSSNSSATGSGSLATTKRGRPGSKPAGSGGRRWDAMATTGVKGPGGKGRGADEGAGVDVGDGEALVDDTKYGAVK